MNTTFSETNQKVIDMMTETLPVEPIQKAVNRKDVNEEKSLSIIKKYTLISGGAALVPYDFVDVISSSIAQTMMIKELCTLYNVEFSDKWINVAGWSAAGSAIIKAVSGVVESVLSSTGGKSMGGKFDITGAAIAAIYTATAGEYYKLHLRDGGTLEDVKISDFIDYFFDEIKRGDLNMSTFTNPRTLVRHLNLV